MEGAIIPTKEELIKFFERCPNIILYGLPGVAVQDRWALLALVGYCHVGMHPDWTLDELEGPYKLSLREIATLTGIDHTALRKRGGKDKRDGVLDRLQQLGYVTIIDARSIDEITGKATGKPQTYLYIHLRKLWEDNLQFNETHRMPVGRPVNPRDIEVVVNACVDVGNTQNIPSTVDQGNTYVDDNNTVVDHVNKNVDRGNNRVDGARSNSAQDYIRPIRQKEEKEKPVPISKIENQEQEPPQWEDLLFSFKTDITRTANAFGETHLSKTLREEITQVYNEVRKHIDMAMFRVKYDAAKEEAMRIQTTEQLYQSGCSSKSEYLVKCLIGKCKLSSTVVSVPA